MGRLESLKAGAGAWQSQQENGQKSTFPKDTDAPTSVLSAKSPVFSPRSSTHPLTSPATILSAESPVFSPQSPALPPRPPVFSPPKAHRLERENFRYHGRHATEGQGYWQSYPEASSVSPENAGLGIRTDSIADGPAQPLYSESYQAQQQFQHRHSLALLHAHLTHLQAQTSCLAQTYRNFGLLFHSFPNHILFHPAIHPQIRRFARLNFLVGDSYQLLGIIHIFGTLSHVLRVAGARLQQRQLSKTDVRRVQAELTLAETLVVEAMQRLELLRQTMEVFCWMRSILWMETRKELEGAQRYRRRVRAYQAWAYALPMVCWGRLSTG